MAYFEQWNTFLNLFQNNALLKQTSKLPKRGESNPEEEGLWQHLASVNLILVCDSGLGKQV